MTNSTHNSEQLTVIHPNIIKQTSDDNSAELHLFVPSNLDYFKGHFPDAPILAGVVQLHWAIDYAKNIFKLTHYDIINIEVLKFQVVIVPEQNLCLQLTKKSNNKIIFTYSSERGQHASGRLVFEKNS